ncbi:hypothetical protein E2K98_14645 [Bacillus salipaludis]|uniref:Uncharacterized protein n=1 Tax=Bacillus salipaludis TaxID=2547811 RepID=A0A4R5VSX7_9BACI|nr:hypothetical protein [Bacillus salipaludis]TDK60950.1 hypothetical protein E2K98_14645 [Bacillus salipaludis]
MDDIKNEYLEVSEKEANYLIRGVIASSMVFIIPFIIIIVNGWWEPLGTAKDGLRWVATSAALVLLVYVALIFDKKYRKH